MAQLNEIEHQINGIIKGLFENMREML